MLQKLTLHHPYATCTADQFDQSNIIFKPGQAHTEFGIQIHGCGPNPRHSIQQAKDLGFTWIKQQVRWGDMSARPGQMDWPCLDTVIPDAHKHGLKVLLSLTTAPTYLRASHDKLGFPDELSPFAYFVYELLTRYKGQVHAIEVWNEPNIEAEVSDGINYTRYTILLSLGYAVAKSVDPKITVISTGLAPVDFDSFIPLWMTRAFCKASRNGARMPTWIASARTPTGLPAAADLQPLVKQYHALSGYTKPICVTEFGYALPVRGRLPCGFEWAKTHTLQGQSQHLIGSMTWARASGITKLVIVWNLDVYSSLDAKDCNAPYALSRPDWQSPALPLIDFACEAGQVYETMYAQADLKRSEALASLRWQEDEQATSRIALVLAEQEIKRATGRAVQGRTILLYASFAEKIGEPAKALARAYHLGKRDLNQLTKLTGDAQLALAQKIISSSTNTYNPDGKVQNNITPTTDLGGRPDRAQHFINLLARIPERVNKTTDRQLAQLEPEQLQTMLLAAAQTRELLDNYGKRIQAILQRPGLAAQ